MRFPLMPRTMRRPSGSVPIASTDAAATMCAARGPTPIRRSVAAQFSISIARARGRAAKPLRATATFPLSSSFKGNYLTSIVLPFWGRIPSAAKNAGQLPYANRTTSLGSHQRPLSLFQSFDFVVRAALARPCGRRKYSRISLCRRAVQSPSKADPSALSLSHSRE